MRKGFTLLELVFVIVIFGIMSKYGADILYKIYENYVYSNNFNKLQNQSESAVKQIANRLQYRIKDSTIARASDGTIKPIGDNDGTELILEWIGVDIDGWRGTIDTTPPIGPDWSGFVDLRDSNESLLLSPGSRQTSVSGALFFIGSDVDLSSNFGWGAGSIGDQAGSMHPVTFVDGNITALLGTGNFSGVDIDVYEYYQFSKSAYAVSLEIPVGEIYGNLYFYHTYQPWNNENMISAEAAGNKELIMENVSTFQFTSMGDILVIQVCVNDGNVSGVEYSICKEKVVF